MTAREYMLWLISQYTNPAPIRRRTGYRWPVAEAVMEADEQPASEDDRVRAWREIALLDAGYAPQEAEVLAWNLTVDLHTACDLLAHGCPRGTAMEILT